MVIRKVISIFVAFLITLQQCEAKSVSLDVMHQPSSQNWQTNKSYFVEVRQKIEAHWKDLDPAVGETVTIRFIIRKDGEVENYYPIPMVPPTSQTQDAAMRMACMSIASARPFRRLETGESAVAVHAKFKSRKPIGTGVDPNRLSQALEVTAVAALVGFAIFAICKWGGASATAPPGNTIYTGGQSSCIGSSACTRCSSCRYCQHCNSGGAPCNVWYYNR